MMTNCWVNKRFGLIVLGVLVAVLLVACGQETPTPEPTLAATPLPTATAMPAPTPTAVPTPTPEPTATPIPTATPTPPPVVELDTPTPQPSPTPQTTVTQDSRPPHVFVGTATINGVPAPEGTVVVALIDGVEVAQSFVSSDGSFEALYVGNPGRTVTFRIGNVMARESFTIEVGEADIVTLTATQ